MAQNVSKFLRNKIFLQNLWRLLFFRISKKIGADWRALLKEKPELLIPENCPFYPIFVRIREVPQIEHLFIIFYKNLQKTENFILHAQIMRQKHAHNA